MADPKVRGHRYYLEMLTFYLIQYGNILAQSVMTHIAKFI